MENKIKLIVSDIDGTLVGDGQGVEAMSPEYYEVIRELKNKGVQFVACSGRQLYSVKKLFVPVAEHLLYACDGGSLVFDSKQMLYSKVLDKDIVKEILEDAKQIPQLDVMVCGTKRAYCKSKDSELYRWMVDGYGYDIEAVGDLTKIDDEVVKVSLYHYDKAEELTNPWFRPRWEGRVKLNLAGIQWLDCVPTTAGKGAAVQFIQEYLGVSKEETICFGDNQNDIEMFSLAKESYAVENAREEVKEYATNICASYKENGVLKVLQNLI